MGHVTEQVNAHDGIRLVARRWHAAEPRAVTVLVHGIGEHSGRYDHVGQWFNERDISVVSFDHRGHGGSDGRRGYVDDFAHYVDDLGVFMDEAAQLDLPIVLFGHSLGGLIAVSHVVTRPNRQRPDLMVLSAPALRANVDPVRRAAAKLLSRWAPRLSVPNPWKGHHLSRDPKVGEAYFSDPNVHTKTSAKLGQEIFDEMDVVEHHLDALDVPTLVIHGTADEIVPPSASAALGKLPSVDRRLFSGFRHELCNEVGKEEVLETVTSWIDEQLAH